MTHRGLAGAEQDVPDDGSTGPMSLDGAASFEATAQRLADAVNGFLQGNLRSSRSR